MGFLTRCKRLFSFAFLLQNRNTFFSFFLKSFLILSEKQQLNSRDKKEISVHQQSRKQKRRNDPRLYLSVHTITSLNQSFGFTAKRTLNPGAPYTHLARARRRINLY